MKFLPLLAFLRIFGVLCLLNGSVLHCVALDREAFSITNYELKVQIDPAQHRLGARGKITLRNDTSTSQKIAVFQISSSLDWRAIRAGDKPLQFVTQSYTSDIDHTGALSEAIVTLPQAVAPHATVELEIAYEGVILPDATRLTRIGTPEDIAKSSDWDQIDPAFTAVRGVGYAAWYPIATEVGNLSDAESLFEVRNRWKTREAASRMHVQISVSRDDGVPQLLLVNEASCKSAREPMGQVSIYEADCAYDPLNSTVPLFVSTDYQSSERAGMTVYYERGHDVSAAAYADAAAKIAPLITDWFGKLREKAMVAELPDPDAAPYESGALLLTPMAGADSVQAGLAVAHQMAHASLVSPRPWIEEGLAHFAQVLYLGQERGRKIALDYMGLHRSALREIEKQVAATQAADDAKRALVNTNDEELYRGKAMCVWWMLHDMIGDTALKRAIATYRPEEDKDPSYMPRLIAAQTQRDLGWFFDDWLYHDRGLPNFKLASAFSAKTARQGFLLTITVENLGSAGAEVPIIVKFDGGELKQRLEVRAKNKATVRVETTGEPQEIVVNDGSVPESDTKNNTYRVESAAQ